MCEAAALSEAVSAGGEGQEWENTTDACSSQGEGGGRGGGGGGGGGRRDGRSMEW